MGKSNWCVLRTQVRQEKRVLALLNDAGIACYAPMETRWARHARCKAKQTRPLMQGYVFAELPDDHSVYLALDIRLVREIMCTPGGFILRVPAGLVGSLVLLEADCQFDHTWTAPPPKWQAGQQVRVTRGKMKGAAGEILQLKGGNKVLLLIAAWGKKAEVALSEIEEIPEEPELPAAA